MSCSVAMLLCTTAAAVFKSVRQCSMWQRSIMLYYVMSGYVLDGPARRRDAWATPWSDGYCIGDIVL
eukprot:550809-Pyramimonas_sp.AAC.1